MARMAALVTQGRLEHFQGFVSRHDGGRGWRGVNSVSNALCRVSTVCLTLSALYSRLRRARRANRAVNDMTIQPAIKMQVSLLLVLLAALAQGAVVNVDITAKTESFPHYWKR